MFTLQPLRPVLESLEPVRGVFEGWAAREWVLAVLLALLGVAGNVLMCVGLQWITPGRAMILRGLEVLAAYFLQVNIYLAFLNIYLFLIKNTLFADIVLPSERLSRTQCAKNFPLILTCCELFSYLAFIRTFLLS
jgi:drug/metabolite transporter (DMT)-like permease